MTSLGKALSEHIHTDSYGRRWQVRTWKIAVLDTVVVSYALAVPNGYVAMLRAVPTLLEHDATIDLREMTSFANVSMYGRLDRWRDYLAQKTLLPLGFRDIAIDFEYGKSFSYRSSRLDMRHDAALHRIADDCQLSVNFAFFEDSGKFVWDVVGVTLNEGEEGEQSFAVTRYMQPAASLPDEYQTDWRKRIAGSYPYNGAVVSAEGAVSVTSMYPIARVSGAPTTAPRVLYQLSYGNAGAHQDSEVNAVLARWIGGLAVREY